MLKHRLPPVEQTLLKLIEINSVSGEEEQIARVLFDFINVHFEYDFLELQEVTTGRFNLIMRCGAPMLTLTSHMDTVPGPSFVGIADNAIWGRGACDAKGQIVAQLYALAHAISNGLIDYACFYVVGEEVDSIGAMHVTDSKEVGSPFLLNGEPTGNKFVSLSAGVIDFLVKAEGLSQHSSIAANTSAIHKLIPELNALLQETKAEFLVNIGSISAPGAANMSCAEAIARVCIRIHRNAGEYIPYIESIFEKCIVEFSGPAINPFKFFIPAGFEKDAIIVPFCSDGPLYSRKFENIMMYGPGSIHHAHTPNEFLPIAELNGATMTIATLLQDLSLKTA